MLPLVAGLMTGGASLLGSIFSSQTSAANSAQQIAAQEQMQQQTEEFNASQVQQQEAYATQMSNTAYQRGTADMRAAGLNPAMMFGSGGPASAPQGSSAAVGTPAVPVSQKQSPLAGLGQAVGSGVQSIVTAKTIDKLTEDIANAAAENAAIKARTDLTNATRDKVVQQQLIDMPDAQKATVFSRWLADHPNLTTAAEVTKYGSGAVGSATQAVGNVLGLGGKLGLSDRISSAIEDTSIGTTNSARSKFRDMYTLSQARQKLKDLEESSSSAPPEKSGRTGIPWPQQGY